MKDRLDIIKLYIKVDSLKGIISADDANDKLSVIDNFINNFDRLNCGRPIDEDEKKLIEYLSEQNYISQDGIEIPYLTLDEIEGLNIKAGTLSKRERIVMQSHVEYTDRILSHMKFGDKFKDVRAIAGNHHETLNGAGYPKGLKADEIDVWTRILTIMDIYDSLIAEDRPYKKPKSIKAAFDILDEEAENGKIDKEILGFAKELYLRD